MSTTKCEERTSGGCFLMFKEKISVLVLHKD